MPTTQFMDAVEIQGSQDTTQLRVQAYSAQGEPLQTWEDDSGDILAQVTGDGRVQIGDDVGLSTSDALVEAHRDSASTLPERAFHAFGRVAGSVNGVIQWIVHELEIVGSNPLSGLYNTLRVRLRMASDAQASDVSLVVADIEALNETGSPSNPVGQVVGVKAIVSNGAQGYIDEAVGVQVAFNNDNPDTQDAPIQTAYGLRVGSIIPGMVNYAIHTQLGRIHLGDVVELRHLTPENTPPSNTTWMYARADGGVYIRDALGVEVKLAESVPVSLANLQDVLIEGANPNDVLVYNGTMWVASGTVAGATSGVQKHLLTEVVPLVAGEQAIWAEQISLHNDEAAIELEGHDAAFYII